LDEGKAAENLIHHLEREDETKPIASDVRPHKTCVQSKREGGDKPRRGEIKTSSVRRGVLILSLPSYYGKTAEENIREIE
jgi:hypothetical protein